MKYLRFLAAILFLTSPALAQTSGTVTNHAFAIGKGAGTTGYTSLLCGSAQLAVGQSAADPICRTVTGDWTISAAGAATLATVNANVGTFGSATLCITTTQNAKGLTTAISAATCTPALGSITGFGTGVATVLGIAVNASGGIPSPAPTRAGDIIYWNGSNWVTLAGNNSGTQFLQETSAGVPSWATPAGGSSALPITPQVRVTLATGVQVMTSSQSGASTVFVTPYGGCIVPIWTGSAWSPTCFSEVSQTLADTTKSPAATAASSIYDIFCWIDSGTNRCTRGPAWTNDTTRSAGTALLLNQGIWTNNASITNGPAAGVGTYVGSFRTDGSNLTNFTFGGLAAACTAANFAVFNAYNRVAVATMLGLSGTSHTYAVNSVWREIAGSTTCIVSQLRGLNQDPVFLEHNALGVPTANTVNGASGIGIDSTTAFSGTTGFVQASAATPNILIPAIAKYSGVPGLGYHFYAPLEFSSAAVAVTWSEATAFSQMGFHAQLWQ